LQLEGFKICAQTKHMWKTPLLAVLLGLGLTLPALGQPLQVCEEEQRQAQAWIQWAAEKRAVCLLHSTNPDTRDRCLNDVRSELMALEQEHAQVYSSQIRTLHPTHPVVKNLMTKLHNNVQSAEIAITTDTEPEQIAEHRKQVCLNRR
jgi:hypothetical protein